MLALSKNMEQHPIDFFPPQHQPGLFRSDTWLRAWLKAWGDCAELIHDISLSESENLTDLSTVLLRTKVRRKKIFPIILAFPLGVSTQNIPSVRSEYFFFSHSGDSLKNSIKTYFDNAIKRDWDELVIPDILKSSDTLQHLNDVAEMYGFMLIHREIESTYAVDLRHRTFNSYLQELGRNTRLKLFNRRCALAKKGRVTIENIWPDRDRFYSLLNEFHQKRWGKNCFRDRNFLLINTLLDELGCTDDAVDLSVLSVDGRAVSVVLDIRFQHRQYNLQSGYIQDFDKKISLGTLHFGYQIEKAFSNPAVDVYDFMAGKGKHSDYKKRLVNSQDQFISLLIVRNPLLKVFYKLKGLIMLTDL